MLLLRNSIRPANHDPISLIIPLDAEGSQNLWAHEECLRQHLHEFVPLAIDETA